MPTTKELLRIKVAPNRSGEPVLPPQIDMARQLGLREVLADEFHTLWWVPESAPAQGVRGYLRGLDRAERALAADLPRYLHLWKHAVPPEFQDRRWEFGRFGRGERFVYEPIPRAEFDGVFEQVKRWGLDQYVKERSFEKLVYRPTS